MIGINSQIFSRTGGCQGLSFAIPIDVAQRIAAEILAIGKVRHARLGVAIQEVDQTLAVAFKLDKPAGALVTDVSKGSAAEKAGLVSGDVIVGSNGRTVDVSGDLPAAVGLAQPGAPSSPRSGIAARRCCGVPAWTTPTHRKRLEQRLLLPQPQPQRLPAQSLHRADWGRRCARWKQRRCGCPASPLA